MEAAAIYKGNVMLHQPATKQERTQRHRSLVARDQRLLSRVGLRDEQLGVAECPTRGHGPNRRLGKHGKQTCYTRQGQAGLRGGGAEVFLTETDERLLEDLGLLRSRLRRWREGGDESEERCIKPLTA